MKYELATSILPHPISLAPLQNSGAHTSIETPGCEATGSAEILHQKMSVSGGTGDAISELREKKRKELAKRVRERVLALTNERTLQKRQQDQEYELWVKEQSVIAKQLTSTTIKKLSDNFHARTKTNTNADVNLDGKTRTSDNSTSWSCSKCTFRNHYRLHVCELCGCPKRPIPAAGCPKRPIPAVTNNRFSRWATAVPIPTSATIPTAVPIPTAVRVSDDDNDSQETVMSYMPPRRLPRKRRSYVCVRVESPKKNTVNVSVRCCDGDSSSSEEEYSLL